MFTYTQILSNGCADFFNDLVGLYLQNEAGK